MKKKIEQNKIINKNCLLCTFQSKVEEAVTRSVATMSLAFIINSTPWIIKQIIVACLGNDVSSLEISLLSLFFSIVAIQFLEEKRALGYIKNGSNLALYLVMVRLCRFVRK